MRAYDNFSDAYDAIPQIYKVIGELNAYASHHLSTGNYSQAITCAEKALSIDPSNRLAKSYRDAAYEKLYGYIPSDGSGVSPAAGVSGDRPVSVKYQGPVSVSKSDDDYMKRVNRENWEREQGAKERRKSSLKKTPKGDTPAIPGNKFTNTLSCSTCGKQLPTDSVFCIFCGQRVRKK